MKTKSYRHKGAGRTGPQLKRLQWKQKMTARSQSRGTKCFKCGEEGHWAKNCKGTGIEIIIGCEFTSFKMYIQIQVSCRSIEG